MRQCGSAQLMLAVGTPSGCGSRVLTGDFEGTLQKASALCQFLVLFGRGKDVKHHSLPPLAATTIELGLAQACVREPRAFFSVQEDVSTKVCFSNCVFFSNRVSGNKHFSDANTVFLSSSMVFS